MVPLGINIDWWKKNTDARLWRRFIVDWRRDINSVPVAIRPIRTPVVMHITVAVVIPTSSLVTAVVIFFPTIMIIIAEGRRYVYTADHRGDNKPQHNLAHYGPEIPST